MITLALDTTTPAGGVALVRDRTVIDVGGGDPTRPHGVRLPGDVITILGRHGIPVDGVDTFGVASGPGGFTGLRVGLATIQGLALVRRRPVVAVGSLEAHCRAAVATREIRRGDRVGVWMDAHRQEVFATLFRVTGVVETSPSRWEGAVRCALEVLDAATVATPEDVAARWRNGPRDGVFWAVGDGATRYATALTDLDAQLVPAASSLAPTVGLLAEAAAEAGEAGTAQRLAPVYVRRPDAELARNRSGA